MLNVAPYSLKDRKMFDINLSDSGDQQLNQEIQIQYDINNQQQLHIYNKEINSNRNTDKYDLKSTSTSNYIQQMNDSPKQMIQLAMKTSPVFKFKKSSYEEQNQYNKNVKIQQSQRIINNKQQFLSNLMRLDTKRKYNNNKNGNLVVRKGSSRLFGNNDRNNIKQKKKIQYLNNSIVNNQLQQICFANHQYEKQVNKIKQKTNINANQIQQQDQDNKLMHTKQQLIYKQDQQQDYLQNQQQCNSDINSDNKQSQNLQIINMPKMQFKQIIFHDPQSDQQQQQSIKYSQQQQQQQLRSCNKKQLNKKQQQVDEQDNKFDYISDEQYQQLQNQYNNDINNDQQQQSGNRYNIFSQQYYSKQYKQIRNKLLNILLSHQIQSLTNYQANNKIINNNLYSSNKQQAKQTQQKYNENIKKLLTTPIPFNNMIQFEVHVYKDLFKTQYQLWIKYHPNHNNSKLNNNNNNNFNKQQQFINQFINKQCNNNKQQQQSVLIAAGYNQSFHIDKTIFIIQQINHLNHKQFIAQLQSNFGRNFYTLHGIQSSSIQQNNLINQILNISLNIYRTIYIPKLLYISNSNNQKYINNKNNDNQNLSQIYRQNKFNKLSKYNQISKLTTAKYLDLNDKFYQSNNIRKSNKTLLIIDSQTKNHILFIGKIASKKYKLMVGQNLSPLQALAILIAHVQCN